MDDLGEISNKLDRMEDACLATSEKVSNLEDLDGASDLKAETEVSFSSCKFLVNKKSPFLFMVKLSHFVVGSVRYKHAFCISWL